MPTPRRTRRISAGLAFAIGGLALAALAASGWPLAAGLWAAARGWGSIAREQTALQPRLLATTLAWALGVAMLSTLVAIPAAWWMRGRGWRGLALVASPLLLPAYLAYSGYGQLRAPRTWLGDIIERAGRDWPELPTLAGQGIALVGLTLWLWPVPAAVMGLGWSRLDESVVDALRLEAAGPWRRALAVLRMGRGAVLAGVLAGAVVMLGSAVPLHLANIPTYATRVWFVLTMAPGGNGALVSAWPLVVVALAGGWWLGGRVVGGEVAYPRAVPRRARASGAWLAMLLVLGVGVPLALSVSSVRAPGAFGAFVRINAPALRDSAMLALATGLIAAVLCVAAWAGQSAALEGRRAVGVVVAMSVRLLLVTGLLPGILVGKLVAMATAPWAAMADGPWAAILAHVARFGWIAAAGGVLLARGEGPARDLRRLDGARGLRAWVRACLPAHRGALVGAGVVTGMLSLHEIEASILVQPPGLTSLAQTMLGFLHYSRMDELGVGVSLLAAAAGVGAGVLAWGARRAR